MKLSTSEMTQIRGDRIGDRALVERSGAALRDEADQVRHGADHVVRARQRRDVEIARNVERAVRRAAAPYPNSPVAPTPHRATTSRAHRSTCHG